MEPWILLVWTVLISTVARSSELPDNKSYTKVSSSIYNNDSFEPDGKGRTISQIQTKAYLTTNPKTPKNLETHAYFSKAKHFLGQSALVGLIGRKSTVPTHHSPVHISTLPYASHVNNAAGASPIISHDSLHRDILVSPNESVPFPASNPIPLIPNRRKFNQISRIVNYGPAELPVGSSIHTFAPAVPETKITPIYTAEPPVPIVNTISSAPSTQVVFTGTQKIAIPNAIQTTTTTQYHSQDELGQYTFGYSGGPSSRHETSDVDGTVRGSYSYVDPYGELQTQHYVADDDGFRVVATNILSNLLRKKRSLIKTKLFTAPANTIHSAYPIFHLTPRIHVPAQTISQTSYLNEPIISQGGYIAYTSTPVGALTKTIHYKEPVYGTGYIPRGKALIQHKAPISVTALVPITEISSHHRNHEPGYAPPKAKALVYHEDYGSYQSLASNNVDYSKITLFRANR